MRQTDRTEHATTVSMREEAFVRRWSGRQMIRGSALLAAAGVGPLLLYALIGPADGNPIGLGLLAVATVPIAGMGLVIGVVKLAVEHFGQGGR